MAWLVFGVLALMGLVAGGVVRQRDRVERASGFPWFWVAFPATCIVIAAAVSVFAWPQVLTGSGSYWWDPPTVNQPGLQFLSNEQYQRFMTLRRWRWVLPAISLVGIALCVWTWRRRHV
ncbi:amino acid permease [Rhodococcus ruber]|uniref:amino acid permease n=1 Tax=Rhodococcus ruber TaxID=1830 RepID=UPI000F540C56|nr:amino acid permease [Rhodococcus ruber]RQM32949.1 amino acid permease [Rhodococcus ruber]